MVLVLYHLIALKMYNTDADILEQDKLTTKIDDNTHANIRNHWLKIILSPTFDMKLIV